MARPRGFDEEKVLDAACAAFWSRGYEATSTRDLVQATGLNPPSLYNAFGDKRELFHRALDHYLDKSLRERINRLEHAGTPSQVLLAYFREVLERSLSDPHHRGCFLVNSALEANEDAPRLRDAIARELELLRDFFLRQIEAGQAAGAIARLPATILAEHLVTAQLGLRIMARINPTREALEAALRPALVLLGLATWDTPLS